MIHMNLDIFQMIDMDRHMVDTEDTDRDTMLDLLEFGQHNLSKPGTYHRKRKLFNLIKISKINHYCNLP